MNKTNHSGLTTHHSLFCTPRACNARGTAAIETAIVLPLYLIVIFGLIYFGYATLGRQRQTVAAAYAAWLPGDQQADELLEEFWPWEGEATPEGAEAGATAATAGDCELGVREETRLDDCYYTEGLVPCQLEAGPYSLSGYEETTFDCERITIALWNMALGEINQYFEWVPGEGIVERVIVSRDQVGTYLADFVETGTPADPVTPEIDDLERRITQALDGLGDGHWLERRQVTTDATYRPPFFKIVYREEGEEPLDFAAFASGDYPEPSYQPTTIMSFDLTGRGEAVRNVVGEDNLSPDDLIAQMGESLFGNETLGDPHGMDGSIESLLGSGAWAAE